MPLRRVALVACGHSIACIQAGRIQHYGLWPEYGLKAPDVEKEEELSQ